MNGEEGLGERREDEASLLASLDSRVDLRT